MCERKRKKIPLLSDHQVTQLTTISLGQVFSMCVSVDVCYTAWERPYGVLEKIVAAGGGDNLDL